MTKSLVSSGKSIPSKGKKSIGKSIMNRPTTAFKVPLKSTGSGKGFKGIGKSVP